MQPTLNNPVPLAHRKIQERLRHDQLNVVRFLLAFGAIALSLCLFRERMPSWLVLTSYGVGTVCLAMVGFFMGRFQIGQEAVLALGGIVTSRGAPPKIETPDQIQAYDSMEEATQLGWSFYEPCGQFGTRPIPRWAHDGHAWFEYNGLDNRAGNGLSEHERLFGTLAYQQVSQVPPLSESWIPVAWPQPA